MSGTPAPDATRASIFPLPPAGGRTQAWVLALGWVALTYLTVPFAGLVRHWAREYDAEAWFLYAVLAAIGLAVGAAARGLIRRRAPSGQIVALAVIAVAFFAFAFSLGGNAIEALHIVQYGVAALLFLRAVSVDMIGTASVVVAALLTAIAGWGDEFIQYFIASRYWDLRDVAINGSAGVLALAAIVFAIRPAQLDLASGPAQWRKALRLGFLFGVLMLVCFAATPDRIERLAETGPGLRFLAGNDDTFVEYGYLLATRTGERHRSRFDANALAAEDRARAAAAALALSREKDLMSYADFLRAYTPGRAPFIHQFRVHLFRRDAYLKSARATDNVAQKVRRATIAIHENRILEAAYPEALRATGRALTAEQAEFLAIYEGAATGAYESPAGAKILTWTDRATATGAWLFLLLVVLTIDGALGYGRWRNREGDL